MERKEISYGIIPLFRNGEQCMQLLIHNKKGHWGFPKGKPEGNETGFETALRELHEETGISQCNLLPGISFTDAYKFTDPDGNIIDKSVTYYLGVVHDPRVEVQPAEVSEAEWLDMDMAIGRATFDGSKEIVKNVQAYLHSVNLIK